MKMRSKMSHVMYLKYLWEAIKPYLIGTQKTLIETENLSLRINAASLASHFTQQVYAPST